MAGGSDRYLVAEGDIELNAGRPTVTLLIANTGDRPIQVGSHAHFFEVNRALAFDRGAAFGMRLDIPSGTAVRFEPGQEQTVTLVRLGGAQIARGMNAAVEGETGPEALEQALEALRARGFSMDFASAPDDEEQGDA